MMEVVKDNAELEENQHIIDMWEPLDFNIDENYKYVSKSKIFMLLSNFMYYVIAFPILRILTKIIYDFKIEGNENIKDLKTGAISVSNHVLFLDCAMVGLASIDKTIYYTTLEGSFKIPFVRKLIKILRAIPIPKSIKNKSHFVKAINELLQNKCIVHFYPEASLFPYYNKIRNFKDGAFSFAIRNNVPIIPMVFIFREPKGIRKYIKKKKDVTLKILKPVYSSKKAVSMKEDIHNLKRKVHMLMEEELKNCN